jgi:hypothetical protein
MAGPEHHLPSGVAVTNKWSYIPTPRSCLYSLPSDNFTVTITLYASYILIFATCYNFFHYHIKNNEFELSPFRAPSLIEILDGNFPSTLTFVELLKYMSLINNMRVILF